MAEAQLRTIFNSGEFFIALGFAIMYAFTFTWWDSWTGRGFLTLAIAVIFGQLQNVLTYWHVTAPAGKGGPAWLAWVAAIAPGVGGAAIAVLIYEAVINLRASPETATTRAANYLLRLGSSHEDQHPGELPAGHDAIGVIAWDGAYR